MNVTGVQTCALPIYVNCELPDVQAGFKKDRGTRDQIANTHWIIKKAREFQKNIYFCFIDFAKAFVWITTNCRKFFKPHFNSTWTVKFQMFKLDLEKAEEPEIKLPTSTGSLKEQESSRKHLLLLYWLCQSLWLCGSQQTVEHSERDGNTRPPNLPLEKSVCRSGSNS